MFPFGNFYTAALASHPKPTDYLITKMDIINIF